MLLPDQSVPFLAQAVLLDNYIRSPNPAADPTALKLILEVLRTRLDLRHYFFASRPHSSWAPILLANDFLTNAPEPATDDEKIRFSFWDAQEYLITVADSAPDTALSHIKSLQGHAWYKGRAIWTLYTVPPETLNQAMPVILDWLSDREVASIIAEDAFELAVELAKRRNVAALDIFERLSAPHPPENVKRVDRFVLNTEAVSIVPDPQWHFEEYLSSLKELDAGRLASILEQQLCDALRIEAEAKETPESQYKLSSWWRSAIEDTGQDAGYDYKHVLLTELRKSLEFLAEHARPELERILAKYATDRHDILRRLRLHILHSFPLEFRDEVVRELISESNYDDIGIHHEFFLLLREGFMLLDHAQQEAVLKIILKGPAREAVERFIDRVGPASTTEREDAVNGYIRRWMRNRLVMIEKYLNGKPLLLLNQTKAEFGEPEHPEFTHWTSGAFSVADVSPLKEEELAKKNPEELVEFLKVWKPERTRELGPRQVSYRGLAAAVASILHEQPLKYKNHFVTIGLIRPEFAYSILGSQRENGVVGKITSEAWPLFFDLCDAMLSNESLVQDIRREAEINWRDVRSAMVDLLAAGLKDEGAGRIPQDRFRHARDLLIKLTNDPDPEVNKPEPFQDDPATSALNHVRPKALGALIEIYSIQMALNNQARGLYGTEEGPGPNRLDPEVESVLNAKLERAEEASVAVHSVYGRSLGKLYWLNRQWVDRQIDHIFPPRDDSDQSSYFIAAWDSYIVYNPPRDKDLFDLLHPQYVRAIDNLSKGFVTRTHLEPDRQLVAHLLGSYLYGDFQLTSPEGQKSLLSSFFAKAPPDTRGRATWIVWNTVKERPHEIDRLWPKIKELWKWRVDVASGSNHSTDFDEEMAWFLRLLEFAPETETIISLWPLLEGTLPHLSRIRHPLRAWEAIEDFLIREIAREPVRVIEFYRLMHDSANRPLWSQRQQGRKILEFGAARKESRDATLSLIDLIAQKGDRSYRDIYDIYAR